jgi:septal ring factor EnvC (AmiA/AmiB activator)
MMTPEQIEAILESNAKAIAANSDTIAEVRRQTQTQMTESQRQIGALIRDRSAMLEILQGLNEDRIKTSENLASIAENVARIANALEQRGE